MKKISITFEVFLENKNETTYKLMYNEELYLLYVKHDGKFHNRLWECDKEIPEELEMFVHIIIRRELDKMKEG